MTSSWSTAPTVELVKSGGGVFEVTVDDRLVFSKKALGRFPEQGELSVRVSPRAALPRERKRRPPRSPAPTPAATELCGRGRTGREATGGPALLSRAPNR